MIRLPAVILSIVLLGSTPAPATAAPVLPPETPATAPLTAVAVPTDLTRVGRLRIRGIGLDASVYRWGCDGSNLPDRAIRWGCSGRNNQFIAGHAYGVFHPYYLAYKYKKLKLGMTATYTRTSGVVTRYRLTWVRLVPKSYVWKGLTGEIWAWGATSKPSITLQTCWGSTNKYRIVTRWVKG